MRKDEARARPVFMPPKIMKWKVKTAKKGQDLEQGKDGPVGGEVEGGGVDDGGNEVGDAHVR